MKYSTWSGTNMEPRTALLTAPTAGCYTVCTTESSVSKLGFSATDLHVKRTHIHWAVEVSATAVA